MELVSFRLQALHQLSDSAKVPAFTTRGKDKWMQVVAKISLHIQHFFLMPLFIGLGVCAAEGDQVDE